MSLDKSDVERISWLARLTIAEDHIPDYASDLSEILDMVEQMKNIDTSSIDPLSHPLEIDARLRNDEITEKNNREQFQSIAPDVANGHYLVPKVID